ncbi:hypothetical protein HNE_3342 [Hyphomonas neptunium ATCC 15444]|uniref:Uncharacterized protein n=1 Tax=Hyphomonas neptunium (strain ATCC 15444) TaxID=228405 RepID=Q0BWX8_HYPNA|nr:hypothetical protein HNE_3342 [Hyphomonas neptunium ATCC 15444]
MNFPKGGASCARCAASRGAEAGRITNRSCFLSVRLPAPER